MSTPALRKRVARACTPCRAKKIRCDGALPQCQRCSEVEAHCHYDYQSDKRKPPSKNYVQSLVSRIATLERQVQRLQAASNHVYDPISNSLDTAQEPLPDLSPGRSSTDTRDEDLVHELAQMCGQLEIAEDGQLRYFGAPSYCVMISPSQYQRKGMDNLISAGIDLRDRIPIVSGLSAEVENELLDIFWTWQNPWQYLVHKRLFCEALEGGFHTEYLTPLMLQSVLALSARYSERVEVRDEPDQPSTAGNALAENAKAILRLEMECPTTSTVAAMAILALREMSVNKEALGWTYLGMAIRIAYNLGLNLECAHWIGQGKITADDAEIRRITFWGCFLLDKLFMVGLGRPGMISTRDVTVAKPSLLPEAEFAPWVHPGPDVEISFPASRSVSNMHNICLIFQIATDTLEEIYAPNSRLTLVEKEDMTAKAYSELNSVYHKLPAYLKLSGSPKTPRAPHIYSLHLHYHCLVILLHRPFLQRDGAAGLPSYGSAELLGNHNEICSHAAEKISSTIRAFKAHYTLREAPISSVHPLGTSAVIHLLGTLSSDPLVARRSAHLLRFNLACLQEMEEAWIWSSRAVRSIRLLADKWNLRAEFTKSDQATMPGPAPTLRAQAASSRHAADYDDDLDLGWPHADDFESLEWLNEFDDPVAGYDFDSMLFDEHLWSIAS